MFAGRYALIKLLLRFVAPSTMLSFAMGLDLRVRIRDRLANVVLPLIDLLVFLRRQTAAIRRSIIRNLAIDACRAVLDFPCFARRHLAGTDPLPNPLLLVVSPYSRLRGSRILWTSAITEAKLPRSACAICIWFCCSTVTPKWFSRANAASRSFSRT
jgi:hypothetical protein